MNDICCIGHITLDKIVTPRKTTYMPGGTSYYFSHGISHLKDIKHYQLVTALAPSEFKAVEDIRAKASKLLLFLVTGQCILRIHTVRIKTTAASGYWLKPIPSP